MGRDTGKSNFLRWGAEGLLTRRDMAKPELYPEPLFREEGGLSYYLFDTVSTSSLLKGRMGGVQHILPKLFDTFHL